MKSRFFALPHRQMTNTVLQLICDTVANFLLPEGLTLGYMTSQRKALFDVLELHRDEALSAEQIMEFIGECASRSAVYRNLSALEKSGLVKKTAATDSNKILYRYVGSDVCKNSLHLECSKCGKVFHLDEPSTNSLIDNVMQGSDFMVDSKDTVLHGVCEKCRKN